MAKLGLDLTAVKISTGSSDFSIVPTGKYNVVVGSAEVKETKNGSALIVGYEIKDGEHEGKKIKDFLNIVNPSAEAQRIAMERLATIAWATGAGSKLDDTDDLLNKAQFEIAVEQVDDGEYKNMKVKAVICTRDLTPTPAVNTKSSKPWAKGK